jgi:hypothetical protein
MGEWFCSSTIFDIGARCRWMVSITPRPLYLPVPIGYEAGWHQSRFEHCGEEKNPLPLPGIEARPSSRQLASIPTELSLYLTRNGTLQYAVTKLDRLSSKSGESVLCDRLRARPPGFDSRQCKTFLHSVHTCCGDHIASYPGAAVKR